MALIAALASRAELLILDEPTSGLDPLMEEVFQHCIRSARRGTHGAALEPHPRRGRGALCDRVSIIRNGRTVEAGTLDSMRQLTRTSIHAETHRPPEALDRSRRSTAHDRRDQVRFDVDTVHLAEAVQCLSGAGLRTVGTPPLEELFLRHYGDAPVPEIGARRRAAAGGERPHRHAAAARLVVIRDRVRLLLWIAGIVVLVLVTAGSTIGLYPTQASLDEAAAADQVAWPRSRSTVPTSRSTRSAARSRSRWVRWASPSSRPHEPPARRRLTRGEEDSGRLELVRAMPVGRHASLAAALVVVGGADLLVGLLVTWSSC